MDMYAPLPDVPDIGWFELEILFYLWDSERYGNEMRVMLNDHLGENHVSTGKLYPVLKKMEKAGYIRKLKKKTKEKIVDEEGVTSRLLTRGVDRVYFEITDDGRKQMDNAISFSTAVLYDLKMQENHGKARKLISDLIRSMGEDAQVGIMIPNTKRGILRARSLVKDIGSQNVVYLLMPTLKGKEDPLKSDDVDFEFNSFPSKFEDIPLKSGYLDAVVSLVHLHDVPSRKRYFSELIRTLKPRGIFITVDIEKLGSSILDRIMTDHVEHDGDDDFTGEDIDKLISFLKGKLRGMKVRTVNEMFILSGSKPLKR